MTSSITKTIRGLTGGIGTWPGAVQDLFSAFLTSVGRLAEIDDWSHYLGWQMDPSGTLSVETYESDGPFINFLGGYLDVSSGWLVVGAGKHSVGIRWLNLEQLFRDPLEVCGYNLTRATFYGVIEQFKLGEIKDWSGALLSEATNSAYDLTMGGGRTDGSLLADLVNYEEQQASNVYAVVRPFLEEAFNKRVKLARISSLPTRVDYYMSAPERHLDLLRGAMAPTSPGYAALSKIDPDLPGMIRVLLEFVRQGELRVESLNQISARKDVEGKYLKDEFPMQQPAVDFGLSSGVLATFNGDMLISHDLSHEAVAALNLLDVVGDHEQGERLAWFLMGAPKSQTMDGVLKGIKMDFLDDPHRERLGEKLQTDQARLAMIGGVKPPITSFMTGMEQASRLFARAGQYLA